jgi:hypothetical protein
MHLFVLESTKIYIKIYIKMLLHVSFCDHHQGARHAVVWQHAATPLHVHNDVFLAKIFNNCNFS